MNFWNFWLKASFQKIFLISFIHDDWFVFIQCKDNNYTHESILMHVAIGRFNPLKLFHILNSLLQLIGNSDGVYLKLSRWVYLSFVNSK